MRLMTSREVASVLSVTTNTLSRWRKAGIGPLGWSYLSATRVMYPETRVQEYIQELSKEIPACPEGISRYRADK